jgi:hypothetical protein
VSLNGEPLSGAVQSGQWLQYPVNPAQVRKGTNRFEITLSPNSTVKPTLTDLLLWVRKGAPQG